MCECERVLYLAPLFVFGPGTGATRSAPVIASDLCPIKPLECRQEVAVTLIYLING